MRSLALISIFVFAIVYVNGQSCGTWGGCGAGLCCSKWGYCGNTNDHCGAGCLSGACKSGSPPASNNGNGAGSTTRCGADWTSASNGCEKACSVDGDCPNGHKCWANLKSCGGSPPPPPPPPQNPPPPPPASSGSGTVRCGSSWQDANDNCRAACSTNSQCGGQTCFKDLKPCGGSSNPPPPPPNNNNQGSGSGKISAIISAGSFNSALSSCGISQGNLYNDINRGFTANLNGGLKELALLMGNIAHESGAFIYTEEIACKGVTTVTAQCPYGWYHGRGYIQISWDYNYREAANVLGNQQIFTNPDIVMNDPTVNWQTVQWYWTTRVQPTFARDGYTMGASVRAINGGLECDSGPISSGRVQYIQCFQRAFGVPVDTNTRCPAAAIGDANSVFSSDSTQNNQMPMYATALIIVGTITVVLVVVALILLVILGRKHRAEEKV